MRSEAILKPLERIWLDVCLCSLAVLLGLPSLLYPFGRDQGLYYYVAREWVLRGQVPYRDVLDHKTPGIYLLHALAILLFGETLWGIRVLDLVGVVGFGVVAGSLYERHGRPLAQGVRGATALLLAVLFYGFLDFWNTAQSELWYGGLAVCSVWAATRIGPLPRAVLVAGVFAGAAMVMKPPALPMVLVGGGMLLVRVRREHSLRFGILAPLLVRYALGAALLPGLVLGYFAAKHALPAMRDIVVGANAYYVTHEPGAPPGFDWRDFAGFILNYYAPFTVLFPLGVAVTLWRGVRTRDSNVKERGALACALLITSVVSVVMQGKYYLLHWGVCLVPFAFFGLVGLSAAQQLLSKWRAVAVAVASVVVGYASTAWIPHSGVAEWQLETFAVEARYLTGKIPVAAFNERFQIPSIGFNYASSHRIGRWLAEHTTPTETISVRGFQPEIYAVAGRRHVGRFFWTLFLTSPYRAYKRAEWLAEDERDLRAHPPKYVVATTHVHEGPESVEWLAQLGYRPVHVDGVFTVVER